MRSSAGIRLPAPELSERAETLDRKLRNVISRLSDTVRTSQLISLNISLLAVRSTQNLDANNAAIQVVAQEIQRLNLESDGSIAELHTILARVHLLTQTINRAGRQRMLSQKVMKLFLVQQIRGSAEIREEMAGLTKEFETTLQDLLRLELNTPEIHSQLSRAAGSWKSFVAAIGDCDIDAAIPLNEQVLAEVNRCVQFYEALAGTAGQ